MQPPSNIQDVYRQQGWNDAAAINADIAAGGWQSKVSSSGGSSGGGGGGTAPLPNVPSIAEYTEKAYGGADEALKSYVMALRGQRQPLDVYGELEQAVGLPGMKKTAGTLREQIGSLEDTIRRVEPQVQATTKESLVTQGQQEGMIAERRKPLMETLERLGTGLGRITQGITAAGADLGTRMQLYLQGQTQALKPFEVQMVAMNDRAARQVSGFSADVQNKLTTLMAQWNRNNQLDDQSTVQAFELLKLEKNYDNELAKLMKQSEVELSQYSAKQPIDLATYEKQKQIDLKYKPVGTGTGTDQYYGTPSNYYGSSSDWEFAG